MIHNSCERDLVTNNRRLAYCIPLLYSRNWYNLTTAERPKHVVVNCYVIHPLIANKYSCVLTVLLPFSNELTGSLVDPLQEKPILPKE
jgi:hypothetical protein